MLKQCLTLSCHGLTVKFMSDMQRSYCHLSVAECWYNRVLDIFLLSLLLTTIINHICCVFIQYNISTSVYLERDRKIYVELLAGNILRYINLKIFNMYLLCSNDNYGLVRARAWREVGNNIRKYMETEEDLHLYDTYKYYMNELVTCNMCIDQCTCSF